MYIYVHTYICIYTFIYVCLYIGIVVYTVYMYMYSYIYTLKYIRDLNLLCQNFWGKKGIIFGKGKHMILKDTVLNILEIM